MSTSPTSNAPHKGSPAAHDASPRQKVSPRLLPAFGTELLDRRRASIQFKPHANATLPTGKPKQGREKRRLSSPPPPDVYQPRVSFDTFDRTADNIEENSFTLIAKHKDYEYTKRSRSFLCGCDDNDYSDYALQWLIDELVDDGDEIVCLRVVEKLDSGSEEHGRYRSEANALMKQLQGKNHENKAINLILEFAVGKVNKVIDEMINLYEPAILVVGTRGRNLGGFQGLLPGSVSKYCLQSSPVPVIVVLPSSKRDKSRVKRAQDPNRQGYKELLEKSGPHGGGYDLTASNRNSFIAPEEVRPASAAEAAAVAQAIGYNRPLEASPLAQVQAAPGGVDVTTDAAAQELQSPGVVMKSPQLHGLDSPEISDDSSSDEEDRKAIPTITTQLNAVQLDGKDTKETGAGGATGNTATETQDTKLEHKPSETT